MGIIHYEVPDELHQQAKAAAALRGVTLRAFLIQLLELGVSAAGQTAYPDGDGRAAARRASA